MWCDNLRAPFLARAALLCVLAAAPGTASASEQVYLYSVRHSSYGAIGTYRTSVEKDSGITIIATQGDIAVSPPPSDSRIPPAYSFSFFRCNGRNCVIASA